MSFRQTCCMCIIIHKGFFRIIYLDLFRIFFGIAFFILKFTSGQSTNIQKLFIGFTSLTIVNQTIFALLSYFVGLRKNDYQSHNRYFYFKLLFIMANIFEFVIGPILECAILAVTKCSNSSTVLVIALGIFWNLIEIYFLYIVYNFGKRTQLGFYGPIGVSPFSTLRGHKPQRGSSKGVKVFQVDGIYNHRARRNQHINTPIGKVIKISSLESLINVFDQNVVRPHQNSIIKIQSTNIINLIQ